MAVLSRRWDSPGRGRGPPGTERKKGVCRGSPAPREDQPSARGTGRREPGAAWSSCCAVNGTAGVSGPVGEGEPSPVGERRAEAVPTDGGSRTTDLQAAQTRPGRGLGNGAVTGGGGGRGGRTHTAFITGRRHNCSDLLRPWLISPCSSFINPTWSWVPTRRATAVGGTWPSALAVAPGVPPGGSWQVHPRMRGLLQAPREEEHGSVTEGPGRPLST